MFLILDTEDESLIKAASDKIKATNPNQTLLVDPDLNDSSIEWLKVDVLYTQYPLLDGFSGSDTAQIRYNDMFLASLGACHWGEPKKYAGTITYCGDSVTEFDELEGAIAEAQYAETRANLFASYGVHYVGPTYVDPDCIFLVDNKKGDHKHSPVNSEDIANILASLPSDWWSRVGIVSAGNVDKLESFFEQVDYSLPIATTTGAISKLKFFAKEFINTSAPKEPSFDYGVKLRSRAVTFDKN